MNSVDPAPSAARRRANGRAVIAGAGIAGLAAAAALAPHFEDVVLFEKDDLRDDGGFRSGASQSAHVHSLLVGGEQSFDRLLPGIRGDFLKAGAVIARVGLDYRIFEFGAWRVVRDLGATLACLSRPAYEAAIRARVAALENVRIETVTRVARVIIRGDEARGVEVLRHAGARTFEEADFVVDARGRAAPLIKDLAAAERPTPTNERIAIAMNYATGVFEPGVDAAVLACAPTPPDRRYGLLFPIENGRFVVTLGGRGDLHPPSDEKGFIDFARALAAPELGERIGAARIAGPVRAYRKPSADWRRFDLLEQFPRRLAPIGDTIASYNPVYGQGMSVAARQALALASAIAANGSGGEPFAYLREAAAATRDAWLSASLVDFGHAETEGVRPPDLRLQQAYRFGLRWLADEDEAVHRLVIEVSQMARPLSDLANISLMGKAIAIARKRGFSQ